MNSSQTSSNTDTSKVFARLYKSLLTTTIAYVVATLEAETGRVKCYRSPTGSGANLQTIQKNLRLNYTADDGYDLFQCDLEGADGCTVAAHCARLGDSTMLDDHRAGLKPAKIIALFYWFGPDINKLDRSDLKWLHDNVFPIVIKLTGKWLYLGCKRVQHGSSYMMGIPTMCLNILKDSFKESGMPIYMEQSVATNSTECVFFTISGRPYVAQMGRVKVCRGWEIDLSIRPV